MTSHLEKTKEAVRVALGEVSALFMSQEVKCTEIVMPTEDLLRIADSINTSFIQSHIAYLYGEIERLEEIKRDLGDLPLFDKNNYKSGQASAIQDQINHLQLQLEEAK